MTDPDQIPSEARKSAVLIPVFVELQASGTREYVYSDSVTVNSSSKILLTKRTETVEHHKGQISFPGGRHEDSDTSLLETALRETEEEVGISRDSIEIIGELNPVFIPPTRFVVAPFIGLVHGNPPVFLNSDESAESIFVPIQHLMEESNTRLETYTYNGLNFQMTTYHYNGHRIWGATARMIHHFLRKLK